MVRSDLGAAGVMFTLDTESGFDEVVFITASYGLGETVVQGAVNPDEFYVYKPNVDAGYPAVLRKTVGSKAIKLVFASGSSRASRFEPSTCPKRSAIGSRSPMPRQRSWRVTR